MCDLQNTKISLMVNGINIDDKAMQYIKKQFGERYYNNDYVTTTGLMIDLGNNYYVTSRLEKKSSNLLTLNKKRFFLKQGNRTQSVSLWTPWWVKVKNISKKYQKVLDANIVNAHFDRARISPITGCNNHCCFCSQNAEKYKKNSIKDMEKNLKIILKDDRINHVLISGGSPKICDLKYLTKVYEHFCKKFPKYEFDVMTTPRGFDSYTDRSQYYDYLKHLKDIGVKGLSVNLELYDRKICSKYCKEKYVIGRDNYFYFLKIAGEIFGSHHVRSGLIVGLESEESTLKAVEKICECGCMPMLSPYVPYKNIGSYPSLELLYDVYNKSQKIITDHNLNLAPLCVKCKHNTL